MYSTYPDQPCNNQCCDQSPCANGGTCTELCHNAKRKFNCTCTTGYCKFCHKRRPTSCKEKFRIKRQFLPGVYHFFYPNTSLVYQAFCDFNPENRIIWTLVESFSLVNKNEFKPRPSYEDYQVNHNQFSWKRFRLPLSQMSAIAQHSTFVRATCNFNSDGLNYTDYFRAKLSNINIIDSEVISGCKRFEYINIRGYGCNDCTASCYQGKSWHAHVDSTDLSNGLCSSSFPEAVKSPAGEDNFGFYQTVNSAHRCSSSHNSTTQWWFGEA